MQITDKTGLSNGGSSLNLPEGAIPAHIASKPDVKESLTYILGNAPCAKAFVLWDNVAKKTRIYHKEFQNSMPKWDKAKKEWIGEDGSTGWKTQMRIAVLEKGKRHLSILTCPTGLAYTLETDPLIIGCSDKDPVRLTIENPRGKGYEVTTEAIKLSNLDKYRLTPLGIKALQTYGWTDDLPVGISDEEANGLTGEQKQPSQPVSVPANTQAKANAKAAFTPAPAPQIEVPPEVDDEMPF
jgi:hypothetical protein